ncbi:MULTISPECIES: germination protein YpeB [Sutcliffiella]|uniref:Germination protein YpeB n=1 Tax=Sutcliffiella cohnii TaxID=33932 RepID=A0A223KS01_9BACI|nr:MULTISPECIES: germination protein YpeB [Sutcliffiella]AST92272.1 germination protein YpeB [Sutcliffiella cohnii]WBL13504.1 germination protein YpeB [Sutcliffiella sp. NC1]
MLRLVIIAVLAIAVVGTGYWGYQEHQDKNAVLINAENNYQRAFHDLVYHVDLLHDKIGTTLAMSSRDQLSPSLAEVWRISSEAQNDVGQLPLALLPFNKTEEFLHQIGDYSYEVAVRDLNDSPLSSDEYDTLEKLYTRAAEIQSELRKVQNMVINNNLRWMDVELALSAQNQPHDNTIINGFKTVEQNVSSYEEAEFGPTFTSMKQTEDSYQYLEGETITEEEAKEVAREFLSLNGNEQIKVTENGEGSNVGFYSLTIIDETEKDTYIDITKKGGYPIYVIQNREIPSANISLKEASDKAEQFLEEHDFNGFTLYESAEYDNTGAFTFVNEVEGVKIYPDAIRMKVSLDDGSIVGFSAKDYLMSHRTRDIPDASISKEEARQQINERVNIMEDGLAIITSDLGEEVLCYEFYGTINNDTYQIFINADNGREESVVKMKNAEQAYDM